MFGNNKNPCGAVQTSSHVAAGKATRDGWTTRQSYSRYSGASRGSSGPGAGTDPPDDQVPDRGCVVGNDHRRSPPRCDRRAARRIPGSAPQHAAVSDGNLRGDRRGGANTTHRLRGASRNGPNPLSLLAQNAPG